MSYLEMCQREGASLQRGMNYRLGGMYSVVLMSLRPGAPYRDSVEDEGTVLIYEGHNQPRSENCPNPDLEDQPEFTSTGILTENGKFHRLAQGYKRGKNAAELVRVYEKIRKGIWSYNGVFELVDSWIEDDGSRKVFKFKLLAIEDDLTVETPNQTTISRGRVIPTNVKLEVWKRDGGRCVVCGATDELHFDHIIPFSKGGTSYTAANIQLLCARHNLEKRDNIE